MTFRLPGTTIEVNQSHLADVDLIYGPMFLSEGMQLRQITQLIGVEPHTVQNWVKRGFIPSPVKKLYDRSRFVRLALLNYFKDVFALEQILELLRYVGQDDLVYKAFCHLLSLTPSDPIRSETKLAEFVEESIDFVPLDYTRTSKVQAEKLLTILYVAHLSIVLKHEAEKLLLS
ncbi:MAG TPA: DUF1836 domain-containing protein [Bacillota bacterium]|nr:DUF1836 domain-containing protein [Bacillota bacterium]HPE38055.1 DUF1836 domain-containing protein [Bacillota bacterium]